MSYSPAMAAPPGLLSPPGLGGGQQQQQQQPSSQQPQEQSSASHHQQPDLSSVGAHTSNAQLAALLAGIGGPPAELQFGAGSSQQQPQQAQATHGNFPTAPFNYNGGGGGATAAIGMNGSFGGGVGGTFGAGGYGGGMPLQGGNGGGVGPTSSNPCRMHQQGHCRYGATCRFTHIGPAGGGGLLGGNGGGFGFRSGGGFGQREFVPQQQQQQQHQSLPSYRGNFDEQSSDVISGDNAFLPAPSAQASQQLQNNPNAALLQALLQQQQLHISNGSAANPQLDDLIASLSKTQLGGGMTPSAAANNTGAADLTGAAAANGSSEQNLEFLQAQAALASLASLSGAAPGASANVRPPHQQPLQGGGGGGGVGGYGQQGGYGNYAPRQQQHQYQQQYGSGLGGGGSGGGGFAGNKYGVQPGFGNHHGQTSLPSFHAGGNFGGAGAAAAASLFGGGPVPQQRFFSDPSQRDARRELDLFGPIGTNTTGINFDRYNDIPVEVTGNDIPGEMQAFTDFDFPPVISQNIQLCKYNNPTPIQKYALPVAFLGRDVMACAQTGSGKTAAFLLPFIAHLVINGRPAPLGGGGRNRRYMPVGLILAPTRELATQIWEESLKFTYCTSIHSVVVYGGQDIRQQFRELDRGCDILVATPGRLNDFVERGRISLSQISYLVLDEADRMLDMGFEPQIRNIVLQQDMSENRQTLMFSATFPKEIQRLAQDFLYNYIFIAVGRVGASSDFITQSVEWVEEEQKRVKLMSLLPQCKGLTLIFVERKKSADLLETYLNREGFHASSIHGDRTQYERENALLQFRNGRIPILVATDVAARGLDIPNVLDVINFDLPNSIDDYVHRIGRTGRAGNLGNAWSFANEKSNHLFKDLYEMLHENKQVVPSWLTQLVETSGRGGANRGGSSAAGRGRFGGKDYRKGGQGYGQQSGGRGGMAAHGGLAKLGRFQGSNQQPLQGGASAGFIPGQQQQGVGGGHQQFSQPGGLRQGGQSFGPPAGGAGRSFPGAASAQQ